MEYRKEYSFQNTCQGVKFAAELLYGVHLHTKQIIDAAVPNKQQNRAAREMLTTVIDDALFALEDYPKCTPSI
jgi:hypothetical protein